jgi:DNA-binding IclR family transcriptional regulator
MNDRLDATPDDLTETQYAVLLHMIGFLQREHRMPTYAEIAEHFEWASPNSALTHVRTLEARGYLNRAGRHLRLRRHTVRVAPALACIGAQ